MLRIIAAITVFTTVEAKKKRDDGVCRKSCSSPFELNEDECECECANDCQEGYDRNEDDCSCVWNDRYLCYENKRCNEGSRGIARYP